MVSETVDELGNSYSDCQHPRVRIGDASMPARIADTRLARVRGHMFRREEPDYALVFDFEHLRKRSVHMLGVRFPLDVVFAARGKVVHVAENVQPTVGAASAPAETVVEVPAGRIDVSTGDRVGVRR